VGDDLAKKQADQIGNPTPVSIKTDTNPYQKEAYGDAKKFADSLSDRSNASITNAMQRTRDLGAGAISDAVAQAGRRGGAPGSGLSGVLATRESARNQQQVAKTNADLTDVALGRENAARALEVGGATDIAKDQSDMFGKQADLYLGGRNADLARARYYADEQERRFGRTKDIAELALRYDADPKGGTGSRPTDIGGTRRTSAPIAGSPGATGRNTYSDFGTGHPFAGLR
jgi:hypothetical protein